MSSVALYCIYIPWFIHRPSRAGSTVRTRYRIRATVPQTAILDASTMIVPSSIPHLSRIDAFAASGPMTHNTKADEQPRNARIRLKPGTRIDTITDSTLTQIRRTMRSPRLTFSREVCAPDSFISSMEERKGESMRSKMSSVAVSGCIRGLAVDSIQASKLPSGSKTASHGTDLAADCVSKHQISCHRQQCVDGRRDRLRIVNIILSTCSK